MKTLCITLVLVLAGIAEAAPSVADYIFSEWSQPEMVRLKASDGERQVIRRSITVSPKSIDPLPDKHRLVFLLEPESNSVFFGRAYDDYFYMNNSIYGTALSGSRVLLKQSKTATQAETEEAIMQQALSEFVREPRLADLLEGSTHAIDLAYIFGREALVPPRDSRPLHHQVRLKNIDLESDLIRLTLTSSRNNELEVVFDSAFRPISAKKNGNQITIVHEGKVPLALPNWSPPTAWYAFSSEAEIEGLSLGNYQSHMRMVVLPSGHLWFGPTECWLALVNDQLIGFNVSEEKELIVFLGLSRRVEPRANIADTVAREIGEFELRFATTGVKADLRIKIASLFPNNPDLASDPDINLKAISFSGNDLIMALKTNNAQQDLEVRLDHDLRVKWARTTVPGSWKLPRQRLQAVKQFSH